MNRKTKSLRRRKPISETSKVSGGLLASYWLVGLVVGLVLYYLFPRYYFRWYPVIPVFYLVLGSLLFAWLRWASKQGKRIINRYMILRGVKFFVTVAAILFYAKVVKVEKTHFAITTIGFYFYYLIIETYLFNKYERKKKSTRKIVFKGEE